MGVVTRWRAVFASALVTFGIGGGVFLLVPATTAGAAFSGGLIANGDFATPSVTAGDYLTVDAGATTISGWTVVTPSMYGGSGGSVDVVSSSYNGWGCQDGSSNCIDLAGTSSEPGGLYQNVSTTPGEEYSLSFGSAVNGDEPEGISNTMDVTVSDVSGGPGGTVDGVDATDTVTATSAGNGNPLNWEEQGPITFIAGAGGTTRIEFDDATPPSEDFDYVVQGPTLDNVSLTAVPDVITASSVTIAPQTTQTSFTVPVATFTDSYSNNDPPITPPNLVATINWGDNTSSTGSISPSITPPSTSDTTYTVNGTHTYSADGTYTVEVTITDNAGGSASVFDSVTSANAVKSCTGAGCNTNDNVNNENTQLNTSGTGFLLLDTLPDTGANAVSCGSTDNFRHAPNVDKVTNTFSVTTGTITSVDTFPASDGTKGSGLEGLLFWVCFKSTQPFTNLFGQTTPAGSAGLLPLCNPFKVGSGPCINYILPTLQGNITEEITYPASDPYYR
jgi:Protein of unknown function (DUF642)